MAEAGGETATRNALDLVVTLHSEVTKLHVVINTLKQRLEAADKENRAMALELEKHTGLGPGLVTGGGINDSAKSPSRSPLREPKSLEDELKDAGDKPRPEVSNIPSSINTRVSTSTPTHVGTRASMELPAVRTSLEYKLPADQIARRLEPLRLIPTPAREKKEGESAQNGRLGSNKVAPREGGASLDLQPSEGRNRASLDTTRSSVHSGKSVGEEAGDLQAWRRKVKRLMRSDSFKQRMMRKGALQAAITQLAELRAKQEYVPASVGEKVRQFFLEPIDPTNILRVMWDGFMVVLLMYITLVLPYRIAFDIDAPVWHALWCIESAIDILFAIDIIINFRTAFLTEGKLITNNRAIAERYLKTWFWIDIISIFPLEVFVGAGGMLTGVLHSVRMVKLARLLKLVKMIKLVRLMKIPLLLQKMEAHINPDMIRLAKFFMVVLIIDHLMACTFYFASSMEDSEENWRLDANVAHQSHFTQYVAAIYWAVSTVTTVGYGDVVAVSDIERCISMVLMMLGATVYAYFMSNMNMTVARLNHLQSRKSKHLASVGAFLKSRQVPTMIAERVHNYYDYMLQKELHEGEKAIIDGLSSSLKQEVVMAVYAGIIQKVPFFEGKNPQFITKVALCLKLEVYTPGDKIVSSGEAGESMFFILSGQVAVQMALNKPREGSETGSLERRTSISTPAEHEVSAKKKGAWWWGSRNEVDTNPLRGKKSSLCSNISDDDDEEVEFLDTLTVGQHFGEVAVLTGCRRTADVVAVTYCELYCLKRKELNTVLQDWPEIATEFSLLGEADVYDRTAMRFQLSDYANSVPQTPAKILHHDMSMQSLRSTLSKCRDPDFNASDLNHLTRHFEGDDNNAASTSSVFNDSPKTPAGVTLAEHFRSRNRRVSGNATRIEVLAGRASSGTIAEESKSTSQPENDRS